VGSGGGAGCRGLVRGHGGWRSILSLLLGRRPGGVSMRGGAFGGKGEGDEMYFEANGEEV
jgi:hypothetical protein